MPGVTARLVDDEGFPRVRSHRHGSSTGWWVEGVTTGAGFLSDKASGLPGRSSPFLRVRWNSSSVVGRVISTFTLCGRREAD
mmetsp:Transcript_16418/g.33473  ORF Transcript_16418/g.33473 Transcript_16418/m.33473 type:complete len:82 (+) Transcript_16418:354-599(+)